MIGIPSTTAWMAIASTSVATPVPITTGAVRTVDPHLVVLAVLVGAWVIDRALAALEWLRGPRPGHAAEGPRGPVETGGHADAPADRPAGDGSRSAAE